MNPEPGLRIEVADVVASRPGRWRITWRIANTGAASVSLLTARLPHDHFFAEQRVFPDAAALAPATRMSLDLDVACSDPPGSAIENAFMILRLQRGLEEWLVFARLRVNVDESGVPGPLVERVTAQRIAA